jgi:hypothetical protein
LADWRTFPTVGLDGTVTQVMLDRTSDGRRQVAIRTIIPPDTCNQIFAANEFHQNDGPTVGQAVRGHTQRHKVPVARMPAALYYQLCAKLGTPWDEGSRKNWRNWLNNPENRAWRMALGDI